MASEIRKILIVDDSALTREVIRRNLESPRFEIFSASNVDEAIKFLNNQSIDLVITDVKMPKISGLQLVQHIAHNAPRIEVIVITGYPNVQNAIAAIRHGAFEYLTKPFTDEELLQVVHKALEKQKMRERASHNGSEEDNLAYHGFLGQARAMREVYLQIKKASQISATVLITGESGTGKELAARAIHYEGKGSPSPFVTVNCGAIPESLIESELFGHMKGAFTGATESRAGFFVTAEGGTIFLDEISETSMNVQVKLLRVLQEKEVFMVGSSRPRKVNVRIIAATNKNLEELIQKGIFREDLYYRLNVINIEIPPLRKRKNDIPLLAQEFASRFAKEFQKPEPHFSDNALLALGHYSWPGNVRELQNVIQRVVAMTDVELIDVAHLPPSMRYSIEANEDGPLISLREMESAYVKKVLDRCEGNISKAANILQIDRKTLRAKLRFDEEKTKSPD